MSLRMLWPAWAIVVVFLPLLAICAAGWWQARGRRDMRVAWWRRGGLVACLLGISLGPAVPSSSTTVVSNAEIFFVVDRTGSMAAEDYDGDAPRLDGVRHDINAIVEAMPGARYSVIAFDSQATRQLPLTTDARAVQTWAETFTQEITFYSAGSAIDRPLDAMTTALRGAAERHPANVRFVFFLADGENTRGDGSDGQEPQIASFAPLAEYVDGGAVLGYGTAEGGRMRVYDGTPETGAGTDAPWIVDTTQEGDPPAVSRIDEQQLRSVAGQLGVPYVHRAEPSEVSSIVAGLDAELIAEDGRRDAAVLADVYWPLAVVAAVLLVWEVAFQVRGFPRPHLPGRRRVGAS